MRSPPGAEAGAAGGGGAELEQVEEADGLRGSSRGSAPALEAGAWPLAALPGLQGLTEVELPPWCWVQQSACREQWPQKSSTGQSQ